MKLSLAAYSFRQWLDLKKKPKPDMTLADFIDFAADQDIDAVELTAYYFAETTPEYLAALKARCTRLGLDVSGTAVGNNFCVADAGQAEGRDREREGVGGAHVPAGRQDDPHLRGQRAEGGQRGEGPRPGVAAIQEACDHAGKYGVYLALENHGGITATRRSDAGDRQGGASTTPSA